MQKLFFTAISLSSTGFGTSINNFIYVNFMRYNCSRMSYFPCWYQKVAMGKDMVASLHHPQTVGCNSLPMALSKRQYAGKYEYCNPSYNLLCRAVITGNNLIGVRLLCMSEAFIAPYLSLSNENVLWDGYGIARYVTSLLCLNNSFITPTNGEGYLFIAAGLPACLLTTLWKRLTNGFRPKLQGRFEIMKKQLFKWWKW